MFNDLPLEQGVIERQREGYFLLVDVTTSERPTVDRSAPTAISRGTRVYFHESSMAT
jgi:hypothetical protein